MMFDVLILLSPAFAVFLILLLRRAPGRAQSPARLPVVVDGSNVMYWRDNRPNLDTVTEVVGTLVENGYRPVVWFDANAGYHLIGRYAYDGELARALGLPKRQVIVVPKGTPADPALLAGARELGAPVVSNDRFRDWQADFADVLAGRMIRGRPVADGIHLDVVAAA